MKSRLYKAITWSVLTALLITVLGSIWLIRSHDPEMKRLYFEVWMKTTTPDMAQLYYDKGQGLSQDHSIEMPIIPDGLFHRYRLPLPEGPIRQLRFDPLTGHGRVALKGIKIGNGLGQSVHIINMHQLHPAFQIKTWTLKKDQIDLETEAEGQDPQIMIDLSTPITTPTWIYTNIRQIGIIFLVCLCGTLILVSLFHVWMHWNDEALHTLIVMFLILIGWLCFVAYDKNETKYLQLSMRSSEEGAGQLFYDLGNGISEDHSTTIPLFSRQILFTDYQFRIPDQAIYAFRFDPPPSFHASSLIVRNIDVVNGNGMHLQNIPLDYLQPADEIKEITRGDQSVTIHIEQNARDPQITIVPPYPVEGPLPLWKPLLSYMFPRGIIIGLSFVIIYLIWKMFGSPKSGILRLRWIWEGIVLLTCTFLFYWYAIGTWHHTMKFVKAWFAFLSS
jgi:hypothetical protein